MRLLFILLVFKLNVLFAQESEIIVAFNNLNDLQNHSNIIQQLKESLELPALTDAIANNVHLSEKGVQIQISFYDRNYVGELRLKQQNTLTPEGYVDQWKENNQSRNAILFLFVKTLDNEPYVFQKMHVSPIIEDEYLFPLILDFINLKLQGSVTTIVSNGVKMLTKALVPIWNEQKMKMAETLINNNPKYKAGHVNLFHGEFGFGYFNLKPAISKETENMKLVNVWTSKDLSDKNWFFSNKYIFTNQELLAGFEQSKIYDWNISFEEDKVSGVYIFKSDPYLYNILTYIEASKKHHSSKAVSDWPWKYDKNRTPTRYIEDYSEFTSRTENDRLIMFYDKSLNSMEGEPIPLLAGSAKNTWCNIFACDLSNEILFGSIFGRRQNGPWGANNCANALHYRIYHDDVNFLEVPLDKAWDYTLKGFVVYLTMFNEAISPELLNSHQDEKTLCSKASGHIATCYPFVESPLNDAIPFAYKSNNYIIQAGSEIGFGPYSNFIRNNYDGKVKAHLYIGYVSK